MNDREQRLNDAIAVYVESFERGDRPDPTEFRRSLARSRRRTSRLHCRLRPHESSRRGAVPRPAAARATTASLIFVQTLAPQPTSGASRSCYLNAVWTHRAPSSRSASKKSGNAGRHCPRGSPTNSNREPLLADKRDGQQRTPQSSSTRKELECHSVQFCPAAPKSSHLHRRARFELASARFGSPSLVSSPWPRRKNLKHAVLSGIPGQSRRSTFRRTAGWLSRGAPMAVSECGTCKAASWHTDSVTRTKSPARPSPPTARRSSHQVGTRPSALGNLTHLSSRTDSTTFDHLCGGLRFRPMGRAWCVARGASDEAMASGSQRGKETPPGSSMAPPRRWSGGLEDTLMPSNPSRFRRMAGAPYQEAGTRQLGCGASPKESYCIA